MFDHTQQPPSTPYRPRPHTCSVVGSLLLAASVPAVIRAISYPLSTAVVVAAAAAVVRGVRTLRARVADRPTTATPSAAAAGRTDGS